jgi:ornithine cyclodeaminase/alanine dehydrogenase
MDEFIILSRQDLRAAMRFGDYVEAVADGFRLLAEGRCASPVPTQIDVAHGAFHLKPASLPRGPGYVAVKINGNFPDNRVRHGLPTIQGAVLLADASNGRPLALLDSAEITLQRTGAATAVAARHLARADARTATICGCGAQAPLQLAALRHALDLRRVFAWDIDPGVARGDARQRRHRDLHARARAVPWPRRRARRRLRGGGRRRQPGEERDQARPDGTRDCGR